MLRSDLEDAALAAAKGYSHPTVEPRHVLFAVARVFKARPEVQSLLQRAKDALEPCGSAHGVPVISPEAAALLDSCGSEQAAVAGLLNAYQPGAAPAAAPAPAPETPRAPPPVAKVTEAPRQKENTAAVLAELEELIGLETVKRQLNRVIAVVQANEERARAGLAQVSPGLHLVFTGPPGTGKTTVARLVARLYASTGALPGNNFTEASRSDLVAGYVGQTALKTSEVITRTRPGVLFIDEAYSLTPRHDSDFGAEAIASLVKAMEDHRKELAVIMAGYGDEMSDLVDSNPGLRSRFKTYIAFPDYSPSELTRIFANFAAGSALELGPGVLEKAEKIFDRNVGTRDFGNARFARSLFEEAYARMSARAAADGVVTVAELTSLSVEDIEWQGETLQREMRRIGFGNSDPPAPT